MADEAVKRIIIDLIPESKPFFEVMPEYDGERQTVILDPGLVQKAFWEIIQWGSGSRTKKSFKDQSLLEEHYREHGQEIADVLGEDNYSIDKYLDDANYIINNGIYVPELNGYVSFMSGKKYGFVGLDRTTGDITTFHIKKVSELIEKARSLGFER